MDNERNLTSEQHFLEEFMKKCQAHKNGRKLVENSYYENEHLDVEIAGTTWSDSQKTNLNVSKLWKEKAATGQLGKSGVCEDTLKLAQIDKNTVKNAWIKQIENLYYQAEVTMNAANFMCEEYVRLCNEGKL